MPIDNAFRHQAYTDQPPRNPFELCQPLAATVNRRPRQDMAKALQHGRVQKIVLLHGTFAGDDALGLVRTLERLMPDTGGRVRSLNREWVDRLVGDVGNYSEEFVQQLNLLVQTKSSGIAVDRVTWSGENHHVGRADAAIVLIDQLLRDAESRCFNFLLWGHSHAGNVFALTTNLLCGPPHEVQRFFAACRPLFASTQVSEENRQRWYRVRQALIARRDLVEQIQLDIVTFGTPIRYGWETRGYRQLLHIVNHRPVESLPAYRVPFPFEWDDIWSAPYGDFVQQLGIAGTDFPPSILTWRALRVEHRLNRLLQKGLHRAGLWDRWECGMRVAQEGGVLLVDYPDDESHRREYLLGHGIYTSIDWLPFHLEEVASRFYAAR